MQTILESLRFLHIGAGFIGLLAFWIPIFAKKGAVNHKRFGRIFRNSAYIVLAAAGLAVSLRFMQLFSSGSSLNDNPDDYSIWVFLGYLTWVTFVILRHGMLVLQHKTLSDLNTVLNRWLARVSVFASLLVIAFAIVLKPQISIVLYALSPIGISSGIGILRVIGRQKTEPREWFYEHLGAMLGCGIAFHTAFAVFGASRLFGDLPGYWSVVPWVAPTAIGIPAIIIWTRIYKRRQQLSASHRP